MNLQKEMSSTYDEYLALDKETIELIMYMAEITKEDVSHKSMIGTIQMLTKIFTRLDKIDTQMEWLSKKLMSMEEVKHAVSHH